MHVYNIFPPTFLGKYLYVESSTPRRPGDVAVLQSAMFQPMSRVCFSFWYQMYGSNIGTLRVLLLKSKNNATATNLWELSGTQGNQWYQGKVPVSSGDSQFQVNSYHVFTVIC